MDYIEEEQFNFQENEFDENQFDENEFDENQFDENEFDENMFYEEPESKDDDYMSDNQEQYNEFKAFERTGDAKLNLNDPADLFIYLTEQILKKIYPEQNVKSSYIISPENLSYFDLSISNPYAYVFGHLAIDNGSITKKSLNNAYDLLKKYEWYDMYNIELDVKKLFQKEDLFRYARYILKSRSA